jgi:Family of unknown function (DUF5908)
MSLEINEIGIRIRVNEGSENGTVQRQAIPGQSCGDIDRDEIVEDCVRRVLQILKSLEDR